MSMPPPRRPVGRVPVSQARRKREPPAHGDGIARCEFCHEKIIWAYPTPSTKARGGAKPLKPKPFDYEADDAGRYTLYLDGDGKTMRYGELTKGQAPGYRAAGNETFQAHFQTCVKAGEWGKLGKPYGLKQVNR